MSRLLTSLRWETVLQLRYGFYYVSALVVVIWAALLSYAPAAIIAILLPAFILTGLLITTYYFMAALVLLEKGEGTLQGIVVTPLRESEYLGTKVVTLAALGLIENLLIVVLSYGIQINLAWLIMGLLSLGVLYALAGFVSVVRFDSLNNFILPSMGVILMLVAPLLDHFGLWSSPVWYVHPAQPALVLMRAAFGEVPPWQLIYGVVATILWAGIMMGWAQHAFHQFVIRSPGSGV